MSCVMCHMSGVTCHVSHVRCHIIIIIFFIFFLQSVGARRWRVCYQRGLPHLVFRKFKEKSHKSGEVDKQIFPSLKYVEVERHFSLSYSRMADLSLLQISLYYIVSKISLESAYFLIWLIAGTCNTTVFSESSILPHWPASNVLIESQVRDGQAGGLVAFHSGLVWWGCASSLTSQYFACPVSLNLGDR